MDIFFFIGTVSFTLTGYLLGVRKGFDWLGVAILALLTAVGASHYTQVASRLKIQAFLTNERRDELGSRRIQNPEPG